MIPEPPPASGLHSITYWQTGPFDLEFSCYLQPQTSNGRGYSSFKFQHPQESLLPRILTSQHLFLWLTALQEGPLSHTPPASPQGTGTGPRLGTGTRHSPSGSGGWARGLQGAGQGSTEKLGEGASPLGDKSTTWVCSCPREPAWEWAHPARSWTKWEDRWIHTCVHTHVPSDTMWTLGPAQPETNVDSPISWADNVPLILKLICISVTCSCPSRSLLEQLKHETISLASDSWLLYSFRHSSPFTN